MNLLILMNTSYEKYSVCRLKEKLEKNLDVEATIRYCDDDTLTENQLINAIESADFVLLLYDYDERVRNMYKLARSILYTHIVHESYFEMPILNDQWIVCYNILKDSGWLTKKED